jgi:hypothetical protein
MQLRALMMPLVPRFILYAMAVIGTLLLAALACWQPALFPVLAVPLAVFAGFAVLGTLDLIQTRHAILRNYPISRIFVSCWRRSGRRALRRRKDWGLCPRHRGRRLQPVP